MVAHHIEFQTEIYKNLKTIKKKQKNFFAKSIMKIKWIEYLLCLNVLIDVYNFKLVVFFLFEFFVQFLTTKVKEHVYKKMEFIFKQRKTQLRFFYIKKYSLFFLFIFYYSFFLLDFFYWKIIKFSLFSKSLNSVNIIK